MIKDPVKYYRSKTNGVIFDEDCHPLTEIDYPDLYYYDRDAARWARDLMEKTSHILESGHNFDRGDPAKLLNWHLQSCCNIYGIKKKSDDLRRYSYELIFIPKKQAKSPYSSTRANYHLIGDKESRGFIMAIAADKQNGKIIHDYSKDLIEIEEEIGKSFLNTRLVIRRDDIFHPKSKSKFRVTSADVKNKHGQNLSALFIDEPHSWEPEVTAAKRYENLTKGIVARRQPLISETSTAGYKGTWFHKTEYSYAKKVLRGDHRDDRWFVLLFEPNVQELIEKYGEEWDDERGLKPWYAYESVWQDVNPAYGVTVMPEYFKAEVNAIRNAPDRLNAFLRLHLNVFTGTTIEWMIAGKWDRLVSELPFSELVGAGCFCGIYTSRPEDMTSVALFFPEYKYLMVKFFAPRPASNLRKTSMSTYAEWVKHGHVIEVDAPYISSDEHEKLVKDQIHLFEVINLLTRSEDREVGSRLVKAQFDFELESSSIVSTDIKRATQKLQNMVLGKEIQHNGNPMMSYQLSVTEIQKKEDTIRPHADLSRDNICGVFASLLAVLSWMDAEPEKESASLSDGFISVDL